MLEESRPVEDFEFIGGRVCLDFINTLSDRWRDEPVEVLETYDDLLAWSLLADTLDEAQFQSLRAQAHTQPALAAQWLDDARQVRTLLTGLIDPLARGEPAPPTELRQFNQLLARALPHLSLAPQSDHLSWQWQTAGDFHELPLWQVTRDAADLLTSPDLRLLRICASQNCDWLFMDTSKNHSRRWCDMKVCGNRAKARRYYGRKAARALL